MHSFGNLRVALAEVGLFVVLRTTRVHKQFVVWRYASRINRPT